MLNWTSRQEDVSGVNGVTPSILKVGTRGEWSGSRPGRCTAMEGDVPIAEYADWSAEPVWISGCEERKSLVPVWKFELMNHSSS